MDRPDARDQRIRDLQERLSRLRQASLRIKKNALTPTTGPSRTPTATRARLPHGKVTHRAGHEVDGSKVEGSPGDEGQEPTPGPTPEPTPTPESTPPPANSEPRFAPDHRCPQRG